MKLKLDYKIWRCGGYSIGINSKLGVGDTSLLNEQGYMCCLGQWCKQLGVPEDKLKARQSPQNISDISKYTDIFTIKNYGCNLENYGCDFETNNDFSQICMYINDSDITSIKQKVSLLKEECSKHDIELELVNFPEDVLK